MLLLLGICLLCFVTYFCLIRPLFLSPLRHIPNAHFLSPFTSGWIQWKRWRGQETAVVWQAFETKGDIVRLGPTEIAVNTMEGGVKTVYGACQEKPERYRFWVNLGFVAIDPDCMLLSAHLLQADRVPNTFSAIGKEHSIHRRRIAGVYTKSYIQQQPYVPAIAHHLLGQLLPHFQHAVQKQRALDVLNLIIGYGLDFVSAYTWGIPQATNFVEDAESRRAWLTGYLTSHPDDYLFWLLDGRTLRSFLEKFRLKPVPERVGQARARLEQWVLNKIDQTEQSMRSSKVDPSSGDYPVVYHHIQTAIAKEGSKVGSLQLPDHYSATRVQLASECLDNLGKPLDYGSTKDIQCANICLSRRP